MCSIASGRMACLNRKLEATGQSSPHALQRNTDLQPQILTTMPDNPFRGRSQVPGRLWNTDPIPPSATIAFPSSGHMLPPPHWIDGKPTQPGNGRWLDVFEPATGQSFAQVADGDAFRMSKPQSPPRAAFPPGRRCQQRTRPLAAPPRRCAVKPGSTTSPAPKPAMAGNSVRLAREVEDPARGLESPGFCRRGDAVLQRPHHGEAGLNYTLRQLRARSARSRRNLPLYLFTWKIGCRAGLGQHRGRKPSEVTLHSATLSAKSRRTSAHPAGVSTSCTAAAPKSARPSSRIPR